MSHEIPDTVPELVLDSAVEIKAETANLFIAKFGFDPRQYDKCIVTFFMFIVEVLEETAAITSFEIIRDDAEIKLECKYGDANAPSVGTITIGQENNMVHVKYDTVDDDSPEILEKVIKCTIERVNGHIPASENMLELFDRNLSSIAAEISHSGKYAVVITKPQPGLYEITLSEVNRVTDNVCTLIAEVLSTGTLRVGIDHSLSTWQTSFANIVPALYTMISEMTDDQQASMLSGAIPMLSMIDICGQ